MTDSIEEVKKVKGESDFCWKNAVNGRKAGGNGADDECHLGRNRLTV